MPYHSLLNKLASVAVATALFAGPAHPQTTTPTAGLVDSYIVTDSKGHHKGIQVEFDVKSDLVVADISISYRAYPKTGYKAFKLKQGHNLRYTGFLPEADRVEYYLSLRPEKGESVYLIGSPANPSVIAPSDLASRQEEPQGLSKRSVVIVSAIVAALIAIFVARGTARSK